MSIPVETLQVARPPLDKTMDCSYPGKRGGGGQELSFLLLFTCLLSFGLYQLGLIGSLSQRTIPNYSNVGQVFSQATGATVLASSGAFGSK